MLSTRDKFFYHVSCFHTEVIFSIPFLSLYQPGSFLSYLPRCISRLYYYHTDNKPIIPFAMLMTMVTQFSKVNLLNRCTRGSWSLVVFMCTLSLSLSVHPLTKLFKIDSLEGCLKNDQVGAAFLAGLVAYVGLFCLELSSPFLHPPPVK